MGKDGVRLQRFYSELFAWKIDAANPMKYGMVDTGSKEGIPGGVGETDASESPRVTFYVHASDPGAVLDRAQRLGGKTVMPVTVLPGGTTIALFSDPEGNVVGLAKEES
jgi:predicted enzyme related to lactoylglutathione lyase